MDVAGRWTNAELAIELVVAGAQVSGTIELGGARMVLHGELRGGVLVGQFEAEGYPFPFVARRDGDALVIESDGVAYRLTRPAPARVNPLVAARQASSPPSPSPSSFPSPSPSPFPSPSPSPPPPPTPPPPSGGTVYRHATGGEVDLPAGWQVTQSPLGLQLVPPDVAYNAHGPAELYLLSQAPAPGVDRADDPRVVAHVDASLRQAAPVLALDGPAAPCGPGVRVRWRGQHPQTGAPLAAVALLRLDRATSSLVGVIALGEQARVAARAPALEAIFGSFRQREGRRDPALVGTWHHWSYKGSTSAYSGSSTSSETRRTAHLGADGAFVERSSHEGIGSFHGKDGLGNRAWDAGYAAQSSDGRTGTWTAGDGMLHVQFADGTTAAWHYQLTGAPGGRRLVLLAPGAREPMEWTEQPVVV
jgi:hypothetical protein